jgi:hypothetical protein
MQNRKLRSKLMTQSGKSRMLTIAVVAIAMAIGLMMPNPGKAQELSSMTVQGYLCPAEYEGSNWVHDCQLLPDVEVIVALNASEFGITKYTDSNGEAFFPDLGEGEYIVAFGVPGHDATFFSYCGAPDETEPRDVSGANTNLITLYVGPGEELYCTFFAVPIDDGGDVPQPVQPDESDEPTTVTTLPTTGAGPSVSAHADAVSGALLASGALTLLIALGMARFGRGSLVH